MGLPLLTAPVCFMDPLVFPLCPPSLGSFFSLACPVPPVDLLAWPLAQVLSRHHLTEVRGCSWTSQALSRQQPQPSLTVYQPGTASK